MMDTTKRCNVITGQELGLELIKVLNLNPDKVTAIDIQAHMHEPATLITERLITEGEAQEIVKVLSKYELKPNSYPRKEGPVTSNPRCLPVALFYDEIESDCKYHITDKTLRWTRKVKDGWPQKDIKIEVDWNNRTLEVDGVFYFYP